MRHMGAVMTGLSVCLLLGACSHQGSGNTSASAADTTAAGGSGTPHCSLDRINGQNIAHDGGAVPVNGAQAFTAGGWVVDGKLDAVHALQVVFQPAAGAGSSVTLAAQTGIQRADVAQALHSPGAAIAGFAINGQAGELADGDYKVIAKGGSGAGAFQCDFNVTVAVSGGRAAG